VKALRNPIRIKLRSHWGFQKREVVPQSPVTTHGDWKKELPMRILAKVRAALQRVFWRDCSDGGRGTVASSNASGFSPACRWLKTFGLGFLAPSEGLR